MDTDSKARFNLLATVFDKPLPYPDLDSNDLSPKMSAHVGEEVFKFLDRRDEKGRQKDMPDPRAWFHVRSWFGLKCTHPPHWCETETQNHFPTVIWFHCKACDCTIIPKEFSRFSA